MAIAEGFAEFAADAHADGERQRAEHRAIVVIMIGWNLTRHAW
jgi:hypothetical protein